MPQLDKVSIVHVIYWFIFITTIFYIIIYLFFIVPFVNSSKIRLHFIKNKCDFNKSIFQMTKQIVS